MTTPRHDRSIPDLVTLAEAASILGISKQGAHKRAKAGQLIGRQLGDGSWVFRRSLVENQRPTPS